MESNHRYLAGMAFGTLPEVIEWTANASPGPIISWEEVVFDPADWGGH